MMKALHKRLNREDAGFTLIELMVVVLIISILVAIAIPTFLGARDRANDRAAQSNLRNALAAEKTFYTDNQAYTAVAASLDAIEPVLVYTAAANNADAEASEVAVFVGANGAGSASQLVILLSESQSGTDFCVADIATGADAGTFYSTGCDGTETAAAISNAGAGVAPWATNADAGW